MRYYERHNCDVYKIMNDTVKLLYPVKRKQYLYVNDTGDYELLIKTYTK